MKTIASVALVLTLLTGLAAPASAACVPDHWNDSANAPIWKCS
jgi:hypothetical protein